MRYAAASLDLDIKGQARVNQYTPRPQDLQQLYDQALAAFEAEGSKSPTPVIVKSLSPSHVSPHLSTFHLNLPNPAVTPPKTGSGREHREQESTDSDDISRIYSIYASDSGNNESRSSASNYHYHNRNNDLRADGYDNQSIHAISPISAAESHAKNRPSSPLVFHEDLRHLYDQVLAGFRTEASQGSPATTLESASTSSVSSHSLTSDSNSPNPSTHPPRNGSDREYRAQEPASGEEIYSIFASDNRSNEYTSPVNASNYHSHDQNNDNRDNQSMHTISPISPKSSAVATCAWSTRSASFRSNGRDGAGKKRRLPSPPTHTQGHAQGRPVVPPPPPLPSQPSYSMPESDPYYGDADFGAEEFVNFSLLSHLAVQLRDKVPREVHTKASIPYERAFTGKDIVDTIQALIKKHLLLNHSLNLAAFPSSYPSTAIIDRRAALHIARSLQTQLLFDEVEGGGRELSDGVEGVYMFSDDSALSETTNSGGFALTTAELPLPTAVVTMLTRCYVPTCVDDKPCYAWDCPKRGQSLHRMLASFSSPSSRLNNINSSSSSKPKMKPNASTTPKSAVGLAKSTSIASSYPNTSNNSGSRFSGSSDKSSQSSKRTISGPTTEDEKPWKETVPREMLSRIPEGEVRKPKETAISSEDEGDWYIRNDPSKTGYDDG